VRLGPRKLARVPTGPGFGHSLLLAGGGGGGGGGGGDWRGRGREGTGAGDSGLAMRGPGNSGSLTRG
jgi:hypothetical protein